MLDKIFKRKPTKDKPGRIAAEWRERLIKMLGRNYVAILEDVPEVYEQLKDAELMTVFKDGSTLEWKGVANKARGVWLLEVGTKMQQLGFGDSDIITALTGETKGRSNVSPAMLEVNVKVQEISNKMAKVAARTAFVREAIDLMERQLQEAGFNLDAVNSDNGRVTWRT